MASIRFKSEIGVDEAIEAGFDSDYYLWQLNADHVAFSIPTATYITMEFTVEYDEDFISEEDMWFQIQGEFDRPYRTDGGSEF